MKSTKKSLVASGLSLLCCVALLVGTTFAWFTDSVVNKGNKIQAGTLDVSLAEWDGTAGGYVEVGEEPIFNYDLWEPGYTDIAAVKIGNDGTLALKYQLDIIAAGATDLAEVIEVYYYQGGVVTAGTDLPNSFDELKENENYVNMGTLAALLADEEGDGIAKGHLEAGMADFAIIALHMQEDAGNEYQGASVGGTFDIVLKATQYTSERDGFNNNQYDAQATYSVYTADELVEAVENGGIVSLNNDITLASQLDINTNTEVVLDLNGNELSLPDGINQHTILNQGDLTIKNGTIVNENNTYNSSNPYTDTAIRSYNGNLVLENCTIENHSQYQYGSYCLQIQGGTAEINNCNISGDRGAIDIYGGAQVTFNGGTVTAAYYYPLYFTHEMSTSATFNGTTFIKTNKLESQSGNGGNALLYVAGNNSSNLVFNNCTFESEREGGSQLEIFNNTAFTLNDCTFTNITYY